MRKFIALLVLLLPVLLFCSIERDTRIEKTYSNCRLLKISADGSDTVSVELSKCMSHPGDSKSSTTMFTMLPDVGGNYLNGYTFFFRVSRNPEVGDTVNIWPFHVQYPNAEKLLSFETGLFYLKGIPAPDKYIYGSDFYMEFMLEDVKHVFTGTLFIREYEFTYRRYWGEQ